MTVGAIALMLMETSPVRPPDSHFAAVAHPQDDPLDGVLESSVPFQPLKWRNIMVHAWPNAAGKVVRGSHFVVDMRDQGGAVKVQRTALWDNQADGSHVWVRGINWNETSIGICVIGDFSRMGSRPRQLDALVNLARRLQERFDIPRDNIYFAGDIGQTSTNPPKAFPARQFSSRLLRTVP